MTETPSLVAAPLRPWGSKAEQWCRKPDGTLSDEGMRAYETTVVRHGDYAETLFAAYKALQAQLEARRRSHPTDTEFFGR